MIQAPSLFGYSRFIRVHSRSFAVTTRIRSPDFNVIPKAGLLLPKGFRADGDWGAGGIVCDACDNPRTSPTRPTNTAARQKARAQSRTANSAPRIARQALPQREAA